MEHKIIENLDGTPRKTLLIDLKGVSELLGVSVSSIRRKLKAGTFVPPVDFSGAKKFWRTTDIESFIDGMPNMSSSSQK